MTEIFPVPSPSPAPPFRGAFCASLNSMRPFDSTYKQLENRPPKLRLRSGWIFVLSIACAVAAWWLAALLTDLPAFILPTPGQVWNRFLIALQDGTLLRNTAATLEEVLLGLLLGTVFAIITGYLIANSRTAERFLSPYLVASQAIPIVAIAPLLVV